MKPSATPLQAPATGVGSKPALPEDLFSVDPVPTMPAAAPPGQPGMLIEQMLQQQQLQQHQQLLGQQPAQQPYGGTLAPGMMPQGSYLSQQPLASQQPQQQLFFQPQAPQQQQQYFMQPQAQAGAGGLQAAVPNGSGLQGYQAGQPGPSAAATQGRTLSGKPLTQSGAPDPFAGLGF